MFCISASVRKPAFVRDSNFIQAQSVKELDRQSGRGKGQKIEELVFISYSPLLKGFSSCRELQL